MMDHSMQDIEELQIPPALDDDGPQEPANSLENLTEESHVARSDKHLDQEVEDQLLLFAKGCGPPGNSARPRSVLHHRDCLGRGRDKTPFVTSFGGHCGLCHHSDDR
ncbi:hypothetical protein MRX96_028861 [Rhipicephalus microplus]